MGIIESTNYPKDVPQMNPPDLVSIAVDLIGTCHDVAERLYDLADDSRAPTLEIISSSLEAIVLALAKDLERLKTILDQEAVSESPGMSLESIDNEFRRILRLCQITLTTLSVELDEIEDERKETSEALCPIFETKVARRVNNMKESLEQLNFYRKMLRLQSQLLTLETAAKEEVEEILRKQKEVLDQLNREEELLRQQHPDYFLNTEHLNNRQEYLSGSTATVSFVSTALSNRRSDPPVPSRTSSSGQPADSVTGSPALLLYGRDNSSSSSRSHTPVQVATIESLPVLLHRSTPNEEAKEEKMVEGQPLYSHSIEDLHSERLEALMRKHQPQDLSGQVSHERFHIASGGLAIVYRGKWKDQLVAVKILKHFESKKISLPEGDGIERHLKREMRVWAALSHPNIVPFYGYATDLYKSPVMISKWCINGNASEFLEKNSLTPLERICLTQHVATGLAYLHSLKIIHGDLKPLNVLIDENCIAQLCDFGLVRLSEWSGATAINTTSPYTGTARYKAPECFVSKNNKNPLPTFASDIYALGCVTLAFKDLQHPYCEIDDIYELIEVKRDGISPAQRPNGLEDSTGKLYWDLLEISWHVDPQKRPGVAIVVQTLKDLREHVTGSMTSAALVKKKHNSMDINKLAHPIHPMAAVFDPPLDTSSSQKIPNSASSASTIVMQTPTSEPTLTPISTRIPATVPAGKSASIGISTTLSNVTPALASIIDYRSVTAVYDGSIGQTPFASISNPSPSTTVSPAHIISSGMSPLFLTDDDFSLAPLRQDSSPGDGQKSRISGLIDDLESTHLNGKETREYQHDGDLEAQINSYAPLNLSGLVIIKAGPPVAFGGYASVHCGYWRGEQVAVKLFKFKKSTNKNSDPEVGMKRRFRREIGIWGVLSQPPHPHIVELYGFVKYLKNHEPLDYPAIISKWCINESVTQYLEKYPNMLLRKKVQLALDSAKGLAHLHQFGVAHGGLKPADILVNEQGTAQLTDFGLSNLSEWKNDSGLVTTSNYGSTARYRAPELFPSRRNRKPKPSMAGDFWALGCVLYEFVYQLYPYHNCNDIAELLDAIKAEEPPAPTPEVFEDQFMTDLWGIFNICWDRDPLKRGDANTMIEHLERLLKIGA